MTYTFSKRTACSLNSQVRLLRLPKSSLLFKSWWEQQQKCCWPDVFLLTHSRKEVLAPWIRTQDCSLFGEEIFFSSLDNKCNKNAVHITWRLSMYTFSKRSAYSLNSSILNIFTRVNSYLRKTQIWFCPRKEMNFVSFAWTLETVFNVKEKRIVEET